MPIDPHTPVSETPPADHSSRAPATTIAFAQTSGHTNVWANVLGAVPLFSFMGITDVLIERGVPASNPTGFTMPPIVGVFIAGFTVLMVMGGFSLVIFYGLRVARRAKASPRAELIPLKPGPARVTCGVAPRRLAALRAITPTHFEPLIVPIGLGLRPERAMIVRLAVFAVGAGASLFFVAALFGWLGPRPMQAGGVTFILGIGSAAALAVGWLLFPAYLRITPGRLEVMRSGLFHRHTSVVTSIDLTRATVRAMIRCSCSRRTASSASRRPCTSRATDARSSRRCSTRPSPSVPARPPPPIRCLAELAQTSSRCGALGIVGICVSTRSTRP